MKQKYSEEDFKKAVADNVSVAGVLRQLGLSPRGGNYRTVKHLIDLHHLDTTHFTGQGWNVGLSFRPKQPIADETIFVQHSKYRCSWRLRERYKKMTGISHCESCKLETWQDRPIPLEIHHVNGDNTDNRIENLQLLCPNCHALTNNYRGRANLSALSEKGDAECRKFKGTLTDKAEGNLEPSL